MGMHTYTQTQTHTHARARTHARTHAHAAKSGIDDVYVCVFLDRMTTTIQKVLMVVPPDYVKDGDLGGCPDTPPDSLSSEEMVAVVAPLYKTE